jgi:hypothetical protein
MNFELNQDYINLMQKHTKKEGDKIIRQLEIDPHKWDVNPLMNILIELLDEDIFL